AVRGQNNSCDIKESEEYASETAERAPKHGIHQICGEDVQQDLSPETEEISETGAVELARERSWEPSSETNCEAPAEDKTQGCADCISELLFSGPNALVPMDFLGNQVAIQNLQLQVKETSSENLRLLHVIEDREKRLGSLLNKIKELDSKLDLQEVQLTTKTEACRELEKVVEKLKKENSDLSEKLQSFSCDNRELYQRVETLEGPNSRLDTGTDKSSYGVIEDNIAKVNGNWKERFLNVENELNRKKSENASIEHHILSGEADLVPVQVEKLSLEDNENKQNVIVSFEEELRVVTRERNRLHGELDAVSKQNKDLDRMSAMMREKIQELESHQGECLRHVQEVEAEVKEKTGLLQTLSSRVSELSKDKAHLQEQLQSLEEDSQALSLVKCELENQVGQLSKEKESLIREAESLQAKLSELEQEKQNIARALESTLLEKGEFVGRLSSTQEEAHQLRRSIEKLRVRIEADEKQQIQVTEKLKESEREKDSLKDKVENLERELQMAEENQELVILDAENAKAEVETLKVQIEEMAGSLKLLELDLVTVRSEKENLTKQLQDTQGQVSELDMLLSSCKSLLEEKEQAKIQVEEESKAAVVMLQMQLRELNEEVAALCHDQDGWKAGGQSRDPAVEEVHQLRHSIKKLKVHIEADEKQQLHVLEQLKESECRADVLKGKVENLERELEISGKNQEHAVLQAENSKVEVENLKAKTREMAQNLRDLELDLVHIRSEKESLTQELQKEQERVSELGILKSSFESLVQEKEQEQVRMKEESKIAVEMLQTQVKELSEEVAALYSDQETCKAKEQNLSSQLGYLEREKTQLLEGLDEAKNDYIILQSSVNGLIQEVQDGKVKLERKEEEISRLKHQIQDQE
ncbi:PREDICTED: centromere protein F-like, partial [Galeopterus variegatus]|uniref:Centromere protein F-like n=1 Tax=Galeopterus variegatus TaxID=482537 RepID=A0ABM0Q542_GALVR